MARKVTIVLDAVISRAATTGWKETGRGNADSGQIVAHSDQKIGPDQPDGGAAVGNSFWKRGKNRRRPSHEELEQRVEERTGELKRASEALHEAQTQLAHVNRVTTVGQLAASITHEINQALAAVVNNGNACLRWLAAQNLEEARRSAELVIADGHRASDIVSRIRALFKKAPLQNSAVDVNEAILEVISLTHGEVVKYGVAAQTQLAQGLPLIQGDRVQLQQVILNLIINAVEAMSGVNEGSRELLISSAKDASGGVLVAVQDSGPGLNPEGFDRLFDAFYTTKTGGMGMGLSVCRSIVEQHGGFIRASRKAAPGATIQFTLPVESTALQVA